MQGDQVYMDWYSWLSKTNLDPLLAHEYALAFARNEIEEEHLTYFSHDFLQSIGVKIAKHRLEILKLASNEIRGKLNGFSRLVLAINKTKKLFTRKISKWGTTNHKNSDPYPVSELSPYRDRWSGALRKINGAKQKEKDEKGLVITNRNTLWSGPIDRGMQHKMMVTSRDRNLSGPLDGKMHERLTYPNCSPMLSLPKERLGLICKSPTIDKWGLSPKVNYHSSEKLDYDDGAQSLWSMMFQDMKPT